MGSTFPTPPSSGPPSPVKLPDTCLDRGQVQGPPKYTHPLKRKWASREDLQEFFSVPMAAFNDFPGFPLQNIDRSQAVLDHPNWPSKPASQPVYHEGFVLQYQIDKQLSSTSCPTLIYAPRQLASEVLDVAKTQQVDSSLAKTKASCAHKASRSIVVDTVERIDLDPNRTIFDPSPPFQRLSSDRYFKNTKFVSVDNDSEGYRSKKQKLDQENLNTPPASPPDSTIVVNLFPSNREHVQDKRDKRDEDAFRKLETKYATRFDRWFRQVLDCASHANPNAYGYFSRELLKMPTHVSYDWLAATESNDVAREQCIIRLHELTYGLLARIRDGYHDDVECSSSKESESASDDGVDPTLRFRAPLNGEGAWKEMHKFWRMLNSAQGAKVREYWLPVIQMQYGLNKENMLPDLFSE